MTEKTEDETGDYSTCPILKCGTGFYIRIPKSFIKTWTLEKGMKMMVMDNGNKIEVMTLEEYKRVTKKV